jgi:outer membrane protein
MKYINNFSSLCVATIASGLLFTPAISSASQLSDWFEQENIFSGILSEEKSTDKKEAAKEAIPETVSEEKKIDEVKAEKEAASETTKPSDEKLLASITSSDEKILEKYAEVTKGDVNIDDTKFKEVLEYVYANHPKIKAQREALKVADEGVSQAVSGFRPDVSANLSKGRERTGNVAETWNYDDTKSRGLTVTQPIFSGGGTVASFLTAKERMKAARAELSATEQQVLYDAVVAYTDVVEKQSVLELNQQNVAVLQKQMDVTDARFKVGELTLTDTSQAKARLAGAQANERQALGDLEASRATFRRTIGHDAESKVAMPSVPSGIPQSLNEAKELAQRNNPILKSARHSEKAASDNVYVHGATLLPNVSLQGTMSRSDGNSLSALNKVDQDSIKLNVSIPIYQSGAEWSRLREARNLAQQAKFNSLDTNESVVESVNLAWEAYNTSKAIIVSNEAAVSAAETALNGVRKENEFGVRTILDVLNAEQETFSARVNLIRAVRTEKIQAYRLLATVGKLTSKDLNLKTRIEDPKEHYDSVKYQLLGL